MAQSKLHIQVPQININVRLCGLKNLFFLIVNIRLATLNVLLCGQGGPFLPGYCRV